MSEILARISEQSNESAAVAARLMTAARSPHVGVPTARDRYLPFGKPDFGDEEIAEVARVVRPGGRLLVTDLLPHDRETYRQQLGHHWLGFSEPQMTGWLTAAGFTDLRFHALTPAPEAKGPGLFVATARRA